MNVNIFNNVAMRVQRCTCKSIILSGFCFLPLVQRPIDGCLVECNLTSCRSCFCWQTLYMQISVSLDLNQTLTNKKYSNTTPFMIQHKYRHNRKRPVLHIFTAVKLFYGHCERSMLLFRPRDGLRNESSFCRPSMFFLRTRHAVVKRRMSFKDKSYLVNVF